jgi:hypothetical protein
MVCRTGMRFRGPSRPGATTYSRQFPLASFRPGQSQLVRPPPLMEKSGSEELTVLYSLNLIGSAVVAHIVRRQASSSTGCRPANNIA